MCERRGENIFSCKNRVNSVGVEVLLDPTQADPGAVSHTTVDVLKAPLPAIGVSSSSGCADISIATLPSRLDLLRLRETWRLSDSMALTVYSVASRAGSTGMLWPEESYWSRWPPPPCSDQEQSSS